MREPGTPPRNARQMTLSSCLMKRSLGEVACSLGVRSLLPQFDSSSVAVQIYTSGNFEDFARPFRRPSMAERSATRVIILMTRSIGGRGGNAMCRFIFVPVPINRACSGPPVLAGNEAIAEAAV